MSIQLIYTLLYLAGYFIIIKLSELLYHKFTVEAEITRKLAHILGSLSSLSLLYFFDSHWYVLAISFIFFLILLISKRNTIFKSIDNIQRESIGSILMPISIYVSFLTAELFSESLYFILPVMILGISDPIACLVGTGFKDPKQIRILDCDIPKTYIGSLAFFLTTFILTTSAYLTSNLPGYYIIAAGLIFAIILTLVEIISVKGVDNLTLPIFSIVLIWSVQHYL